MNSLALSPGAIFDSKFLVLASLGAGGMGAVYKAKQIGFERIVALKLLDSVLADFDDSEMRFEREAKILSMLEHVNIAKFFVYGISTDKVPYLALEYVDGQSLRQRLSGQPRLPWMQAILYSMQICDALSYAHKSAVIHRDLKPENIMLEAAAGAERVVLIDFGLSKLSDPQMSEIQKLTKTGDLIGSVNYLSPELCKGLRPDARSDIYALGVILYEAVSGTLPFSADSPMGVIYKHANEQPAVLDEQALTIPLQLRHVIEKAIAKNVDERYQNVDELKADLLALSENRLEKIDIRSQHSEKRNKLILPMMAALILAGIIAISMIFPSIKHVNPDDILEDGKSTGPLMHSVQGLSLRKAADLEVQIDSMLRSNKGIEAEASALKWIEEHTKLGKLEPAEISISATSLGRAQSSLGDHEEALETYEKGLGQLDDSAKASAADRVRVLSAIVGEAGCLGRQPKLADAQQALEQILREPKLAAGIAESVRLNIVSCMVSRHQYEEALQFIDAYCKVDVDQRSLQRQRAICLFLLNRNEEAKTVALAYAGAGRSGGSSSVKNEFEQLEDIQMAYTAAACAEFTSHFDSAIELLAPALEKSRSLIDGQRAAALNDLANWKVMRYAGKGRNKGEILDREKDRNGWISSLREGVEDSSEAAQIFGHLANAREQFRALARAAFFHLLLDDEASYKQTIEQIYGIFKPHQKASVDRWLSTQMYAYGSVALASGWNSEAMRILEKVESIYRALGNEKMVQRCRAYYLKAEKLDLKDRMKKEHKNLVN